MYDARLVGPVLHLTRFRVFDRGRNIRRNSTHLRVGHQAARAQHLTQRAHDTHGVWRGDHDIERHVATLDALSQVFHTNDIGAGGFCLISFGSGGEYGDAHGLAGAGRQHDRTTNDLVGFLCIDAQLNGDVD